MAYLCLFIMVAALPEYRRRATVRPRAIATTTRTTTTTLISATAAKSKHKRKTACTHRSSRCPLQCSFHRVSPPSLSLSLSLSPRSCHPLGVIHGDAVRGPGVPGTRGCASDRLSSYGASLPRARNRRPHGASRAHDARRECTHGTRTDSYRAPLIIGGEERGDTPSPALAPLATADWCHCSCATGRRRTAPIRTAR